MHIAEELARDRAQSVAEIAAVTRNNSLRFFDLPGVAGSQEDLP